MKIILDFDDFSPRNTNFSLLEELREHFPGFKATLFTVPWEIRFGVQTPITEYKDVVNGKERNYGAFIKACQLSKDWLEIALHGLTHAPEEFLNLSYDEARRRLLLAEKMFLNTGIPYVKLFKAPYWQLSKEAKRAAEELGWKVVEDGYYNWNLRDEKPMKRSDDDPNLILGHGHVQITMGNGIEEAFQRLMAIPSDYEFGFLSEHFKADSVDPLKLDFRDPLEQVEIVERKEAK